MFKHSATALAVVLATTWNAYAESNSNEAEIMQSGDNNTATIMQSVESSGNKAQIEQTEQSSGGFVKVEQDVINNVSVQVKQGGDGNVTEIRQSGHSDRSLIEVDILGDANVADVKQVVEAVDSQAFVQQHGQSNQLVTHQSDIQGSIVSVQQHGDSNRVDTQHQFSNSAGAYIHQTGNRNETQLIQLSSDSAQVSISQVGDDNTIRVTQNTQSESGSGLYSDSTRANIIQQGHLNDLVIEQYQANNQLDIAQAGSEGRIELLQNTGGTGIENSAVIHQGGVAEVASVVQSGEYNQFRSFQRGFNNIQSMRQDGREHQVESEQTAQSISSRMEFNQQGSGHYISAQQDIGEGNVMTVQQLGENNSIESHMHTNLAGLVNTNGHFNTLNVLQSGSDNVLQGGSSGMGTDVLLEQVGQTNKMSAIADGVGSRIHAHQMGQELSANIFVESGADLGGNVVRLDQSGMLNSASLNVGGANNVMWVAQGPMLFEHAQ